MSKNVIKMKKCENLSNPARDDVLNCDENDLMNEYLLTQH